MTGVFFGTGHTLSEQFQSAAAYGLMVCGLSMGFTERESMVFQFNQVTSSIVVSFAAVSFGGFVNVAEAQGGVGGSGGFFNSKPADHQHIPAPAIAEKPCNSVPASAITKGSFTVWTEPKDPKPGQQYRIMVEVKVSEKLDKYPRCDISGSVLGTDGYKDYFGGPTEPGYYGVKDQRVRFEVMVPGAAQLVEDVIEIKSKLLKEEHEIKLEF